MRTIQFEVTEAEYEIYKMLLKEKYKWRSYLFSDALDELMTTYYEYEENDEEPYWKYKLKRRRECGLPDH